MTTAAIEVRNVAKTFKAGKRSGQGKMTYTTGQVAEGIWQDGILTAPPAGTPEAPADGAAPAEPPTEPAVTP